MSQLIMRWFNDGTKPKKVKLPDGFEVFKINDIQNGVDIWLDIVQYGLSEGKQEYPFYAQTMLNWPCYDPDYCYIISYNGQYAATIAIICNYETGEGYIHMVACKPKYRGMGIGNLMNEIAVEILKERGMKTAHLTTDDWRIPAIKSYLKFGFIPDESSDDFKSRWNKIREIISK